MTTYKSVSINRIYLDPANPRHDPINNEREIIAHLLKTEDIRPLAKSISTLGSTSPIELLALAPHPTAKNRFNTALLHKSKKVDMTPTPDAATPQQAPPPLWGTQVA